MKRIGKHMIAAMLGIMLMLSTIVPAIQAEESTPDISTWALETLNEGEKYGIFPTQWYYEGFTSEVSIERVNELIALTEKKIAALELPKNKKYSPISYKGDTTRGDIINRLYNIVASYDLPVGKDAVAYMTERKILQGSSNGLGLKEKATTQHAVVLAVRLVKDTFDLAQQGSKGVAWVVEDEDTKVYLLGSIHVGTPDLYPINKKLLTAFDEADALLVEANVVDEKDLEYFTGKAMYADGITLRDNVSAETYEKIEKVAQQYQLPMEQLVIQKPWALSSTLSFLAADETIGLSPQEMAMHGIDTYFLSNALLQEKPIIELEGVKAQADMLDGLSPEAQEQYLVATVDSILEPSAESEYDMMQEWFSSWKKGEILAFAESFKEMEGETSEFNEMLFGLRDEQMAKKIVSLLEDEKGKYFVVVGAGHFAIEKSIRYHLEQSGYDVEPFYQ
ncbi:TraB/GumN family protein [Lysinibacillus sp. NPDC097287]|uniref:TraB/GumN family protein n=1 Tax=Lysinibacillus sp. NPDC097287 TaxID=3364144 RepID=UPI003827DE36